jgi:hypothetical protein
MRYFSEIRFRRWLTKCRTPVPLFAGSAMASKSGKNSANPTLSRMEVICTRTNSATIFFLNDPKITRSVFGFAVTSLMRVLIGTMIPLVDTISTSSFRRPKDIDDQ